MSKKIVAIIIASVILFCLISLGVFYAVYTIADKALQGEFGEYAEQESNRALTKKMLAGMPDEEIEYEIINNIWYSKIGEDSENEYELASKLPDSSKYLYATWTFENEFYNGGFAQFFYTYSGDFAKEAVEGYKFFGATEHADLLAKAIKVYEQEQELFQSAEADESSNAFYKLYKQSEMSKLDDEFEKLSNDVSKMKIKYIREHLDEFAAE